MFCPPTQPCESRRAPNGDAARHLAPKGCSVEKTARGPALPTRGHEGGPQPNNNEQCDGAHRRARGAPPAGFAGGGHARLGARAAVIFDDGRLGRCGDGNTRAFAGAFWGIGTGVVPAVGFGVGQGPAAGRTPSSWTDVTWRLEPRWGRTRGPPTGRVRRLSPVLQLCLPSPRGRGPQAALRRRFETAACSQILEVANEPVWTLESAGKPPASIAPERVHLISSDPLPPAPVFAHPPTLCTYARRPCERRLQLTVPQYRVVYSVPVLHSLSEE